MNTIKLNPGEHYAGIIIGKEGNPNYHLILLDEEAVDINWQDAVDWAAVIHRDLPTRREQALLFANLPEQFEPKWYWSSEKHATDSDYAWVQHFSNGTQYYYDKSYSGHARAVRRVPTKETL